MQILKNALIQVIGNLLLTFLLEKPILIPDNALLGFYNAINLCEKEVAIYAASFRASVLFVKPFV